MDPIQAIISIQSHYRGHLTRKKYEDCIPLVRSLRKEKNFNYKKIITYCQIVEDLNSLLQNSGFVFPINILEILKNNCYDYYHRLWSLWLIQKSILVFKIKTEAKKLMDQVSFQIPLKIVTSILEWKQKYKNLLYLIDQNSMNILTEIDHKFEDSFKLVYQELCTYIDNFAGSSSSLLECDLSSLSNITRLFSLENLGQTLRKRLYESKFLNINIQRSLGFLSGRSKQIAQSKYLILMMTGVPISEDYQSHHLRLFYQQILHPHMYPNTCKDKYYSDIQIEVTRFAVCLNLSSDFNLKLLASHILKSKIPQPSAGFMDFSLGSLTQFSTQFQKINDIDDSTFDFQDSFLSLKEDFRSSKCELNKLEFLINHFIGSVEDDHDYEDNGTFDSYSSDEDVDDASENTRVSPSSRTYSYNTRAESVVRPESSGNIEQSIRDVGTLVGFGHVGRGVAQTMEASHFSESSSSSPRDTVDPDLYRQYLERQQQLVEERREINEARILEAKKIYSSFGEPYLSTVIRKITPLDILNSIYCSDVSMTLKVWENSFSFIEQLHQDFYQEAVNFTSTEFSKLVSYPEFSDFYSKNEEIINQFLVTKNIMVAPAVANLEIIQLPYDSERQSSYLKIVIGMIHKKKFREQAFHKNFSKLNEAEYPQLETSLGDVNEKVAQIVRDAIQNASNKNKDKPSKGYSSKKYGKQKEISVENLERRMEGLALGKTK